MIPQKIQIIGEGNVAFHLAQGFCCIPEVLEVTILSRRARNKNIFINISDKIKIGQLSNFDKETLITFIAVADDAIREIVNNLVHYQNLLVHTSGSTSSEVFSSAGVVNYGTFYPLQTFSLHKDVLWPEIPLFINSNKKANDDLLFELASQLSYKTQFITDEKRLNIHIAAVMVNNFTNHLYVLSEKWLAENELDFKILLPLIQETTDKLTVMSPKDAQTGPAKRKDHKIIQLHLDAIADHTDLNKIYNLLSESISG